MLHVTVPTLLLIMNYTAPGLFTLFSQISCRHMPPPPSRRRPGEKAGGSAACPGRPAPLRRFCHRRRSCTKVWLQSVHTDVLLLTAAAAIFGEHRPAFSFNKKCTTSAGAAAAGRTPTSAKELPADGASNCIIRQPRRFTINCFRSITRLNAAKKSAPMSGKDTAANKNCQRNCWPPKFTASSRHPQHGMGLPLADVIGGPIASSSEW
jgi:hypothetical protein